METITKQINVFTFAELSDSAKERALQWHCEHLENYWAESVIDDAKTIGALMGFDIDKIHYSGFWSQGDGACFSGRIRYAKGCAANVKAHAPQDTKLQRIATDWQDLQRKNFYSLSAVVRQSGHYSHSGCTSFDCEQSGKKVYWSVSDDAETELKRVARSFMDWIYSELESAYNFATSAESFSEDCEANNWRFTVNGKFFAG